MLKFACLRNGEQTGQGDFSLGAAVTVRDFANEHEQAQGSLADVVGGLHALVFEEGKEPVIMLEKSPGEIADIAVSAVQMPFRQRENLFLNGDGS